MRDGMNSLVKINYGKGWAGNDYIWINLQALANPLNKGGFSTSQIPIKEDEVSWF